MPNKSLGQHWLKDNTVLQNIAHHADLVQTDTVLEIGPGLGTLTSILLQQVEKVVAVEFDQELARKLPGQFPGKNLEVFQSDILSFDLSSLPSHYKVVANVPYYITSKIVHLLMTADNKPSTVVLLVQKEVAERLAASPGDMSVLAISAQLFAEVSLGEVVGKKLFTPPPQVDSQVVVLHTRTQSLVDASSQQLFFQIVKAGFSEKRKKLRSSLSGGFHIDKEQTESWLLRAGISPDARAQDLSIAQWKQLMDHYKRV